MERLSPAAFTFPEMVAALRAAAEPTRLRIVMLLADGELTVKDLTRILGQSQPRISRHLKLLAEARLVERFREGNWAHFRLAAAGPGASLARQLTAGALRDDEQPSVDRERLRALRTEREAAAQTYFQAHAADWDRIRALHVPEARVEAAILEALGDEPFGVLLDLGTGTGRMLELLAERYRHGYGLDVSAAMLGYARAKLEQAGVHHAQLRLGDLYSLNVVPSSADVIVMHQVLHFLRDPARAIAEAARALKPGGRLLIVDFAPHEIEFLRDQLAHERLGVAGAELAQWLASAGLTLSREVILDPEASPADRPTGAPMLTVTLWLATSPARGALLASSSQPQRLREVVT